MAYDRIVAVGFLTAADLSVLGQGFRRHFAVDHDEVFADLLTQLDRIEVAPLENGVMLQQKRDA